MPTKDGDFCVCPTASTGQEPGRLSLLRASVQRSAGATSAGAGFSLVEVVLALGVGIFALMVLVAIIPTGLRVNQDSREDYRAAELLRQIGFDLTDGSASSGGSRFGIPQLHHVDGTTEEENYPEPTGSVFLTGEFHPADTDADRFYQLIWRVHRPSATGLGRAWVHLRLQWPAGTGNSQASAIETGFLLGERR